MYVYMLPLADCFPAALNGGNVRTSTVRSSQVNTRPVLYLHLVDQYLQPLHSHMYVCMYVSRYVCMYVMCGARGSIVVKALCYKPEGRGFDTR
jgi:hypothetical protein